MEVAALRHVIHAFRNHQSYLLVRPVIAMMKSVQIHVIDVNNRFADSKGSVCAMASTSVTTCLVTTQGYEAI